MPIEKLDTVDAFIVFDLADAPESVGVVRSARKILPSGATDLARSMTYAFATFEMRRSGASAGINAVDDDRADAVAKFAAEIAPMVTSGRFMPEPGTRVPRTALAPLAGVDPRAAVGDLADQATVAGAVAAAAQASGGLDGRTVAIEGSEPICDALAIAVEEQGGTMVEMNGQADVLFAGSKMGAIDHTVAEQINVNTLVPYSPIPVTARALAILGRAGTTVVPDFIATAGPLFAWWPSGDPTPEAITADAAAKITASLEEIADHPDGLFLAAAYRAESFLATWQDSLPFGRPLAS
ncbi:hypothetical protein [Candidatus Poriferisocius sp.]|uniref:hypothetical protein n=1 Tax=Candidatus Poriferisocius sp. TaxID=3101276 RepID=UPI003B02D88F